MSLVTLKRYLAGPAEEQSTLRRVVSLLLHGIALHAVQGDSADFERFRSDLERIQVDVSGEVPAADLLVAAGGAVQALSDHSQRTTRFIRQQGAELQNMVSMLTHTLITVGDVGERSCHRLKEIEGQLERASAIEDVQKLRLRLSDCLTSLREEAVRQKTETDLKTAAIGQQLEQTRDRVRTMLAHSDDLDAVTGLPNQAVAEAAFHEAVQEPGRKYVIIAVANRIQAVNMRFGYAVGDQVIKALADSIRARLSAQDRIFRWQGPALVGLIAREETIDAVRGEIRRIGEHRLEKMFDVGGRQVLIPVSASWSVVALLPPSINISRHIETFVASQSVKEYC